MAGREPVAAASATRPTRYSAITISPLKRIAPTFVRKSRSAPSACSPAPDSSVSPATTSGGTSEIAIATPGSVSETSVARQRERADRAGGERGDEVDQPRVHARRDLRVRRRRRTGSGARCPKSQPIATTAAAPPTTSSQRPGEVRAVARDDREHRAEDRRHQRRDDHRADHRRGRVGERPPRSRSPRPGSGASRSGSACARAPAPSKRRSRRIRPRSASVIESIRGLCRPRRTADG